MEQVDTGRAQAGKDKANVLFLCTGNSARSQMAEAFLRRYTGDRFSVHSAGLKPSTINPLTVRVVEEVGVDMTGHHAKSVRDFLGWSNFATIITVCARAEKNCPSTFPGRPTKLAWSFEDPAAFGGDDEAKLEVFGCETGSTRGFRRGLKNSNLRDGVVVSSLKPADGRG